MVAYGARANDGIEFMKNTRTKIYADYNASAPLHPKVKNFLLKRLGDDNSTYANPNALHALGVELHDEMESARTAIAEMLGAYPEQVIFTSGSSESINTVFWQTHFWSRQLNPKENFFLYSSPLEHAAVHANIQQLSALWPHTKTSSIPVTPQGIFDEYQALCILDQKVNGLVALMSVNNELGTIQPLEKITQQCLSLKIPILVDTTQHIGKLPFHFQNSSWDFSVLSGHKLGAPLGIGALLVKDPLNLHPLMVGGGQEFGLRSGTQNYLGILALKIALEEELSTHAQDKRLLINTEREKFEMDLKKEFSTCIIFGEDAPRVYNTTLCSFPGIHGQALQIECETRGIYITTSSACADNSPETSRILQALDVPDSIGRGAIRISTGAEYQKGDYQRILLALKASLTHLEKISY